MKLSLFSTILILLGGFFYAQSLPFKHYTIKDGLLQNQTFALEKDYNGFLWIGTYNGLCRFDGKTFKNYNNNPYLKHRIIDIISLGDTLMVASLKGLSFIYNNKIVSYDYPKKFRAEIDVRVIIKGEKLYYFVKRTRRPYCFNLKTKEFEKPNFQFSKELSKVNDFKFTFHPKSSDTLLIRSMSYDSFNIYYVKNDTIYKSNQKWSEYELASFRGQRSLTLYYNYKPELKNKLDFLKDKKINDEFIDSNGVIWYATEQGLFKVPSLAFEHYGKKEGMPNYVWSIAEDKNKNLWFGSWGNGLYKYDGQNFIKKNLTFTVPESKNVHPSNNYYMGASQTKTGFYLPCSNTLYENDNNNFTELNVPKDDYLFTYSDSFISLFAGTKNLVVKRNDSITLYPNKKYNTVLFQSIIKDKKGRFWLSNQGLESANYFNGKGYINLDKDEIPLKSGFITSAKDQFGNLWLGNTNGVIVHRYKDVDTIQELKGKSILSIKNYKDSLIIIGSELGVGLIDLKKYYRGKNYYKYLDEEDGFFDEEVAQNGLFIDSKNHIWYPTNRNVSKLEINKLKFAYEHPNFYFKTFQYSDENLNWQIKDIEHFNSDSILTINYPNKNIQIDFDFIELGRRKDLRFSYYLEGYNKEWSDLSLNTNAVYTNLPYGVYKFHLKGTNLLNDEEAITKTFTFEIKPVFWQTLWFKILCIVLLILLTFLLSKLYFSIQNKKEQKQRTKLIRLQKQIKSLQVKNLNNKLNPHDLKNSLSGVLFQLENQSPELHKKMSKIVSNLKRSAYNNELTHSLHNELLETEDYIKEEQKNFYAPLTYKIDNQIKEEIEIPRLILKNFAENSVKHSFKSKVGGHIQINIQQQDNFIELVVDDNGSGRKQTNNKGIGISTYQDLFSILNEHNAQKATLEIIDKAQGTQVKVRIPKNYKYTTDGI